MCEKESYIDMSIIVKQKPLSSPKENLKDSFID